MLPPTVPFDTSQGQKLTTTPTAMTCPPSIFWVMATIMTLLFLLAECSPGILISITVLWLLSKNTRKPCKSQQKPHPATPYQHGHHPLHPQASRPQTPPPQRNTSSRTTVPPPLIRTNALWMSPNPIPLLPASPSVGDSFGSGPIPHLLSLFSSLLSIHSTLHLHPPPLSSRRCMHLSLLLPFFFTTSVHCPPCAVAYTPPSLVASGHLGDSALRRLE